jgi:hypothetical protein
MIVNLTQNEKDQVEEDKSKTRIVFEKPDE